MIKRMMRLVLVMLLCLGLLSACGGGDTPTEPANQETHTQSTETDENMAETETAGDETRPVTETTEPQMEATEPATEPEEFETENTEPKIENPTQSDEINPTEHEAIELPVNSDEDSTDFG